MRDAHARGRAGEVRPDHGNGEGVYRSAGRRRRPVRERAGRARAVWQAIYDHYKPVSMEDSIPRTHAGRIVALADKLDTLRGCFRWA